MRDLAASWPPIPDWNATAYDGNGIRVTTVNGLTQHLVSGNLTPFGDGVGALGLAERAGAVLRVARDRILVVDADVARITAGWHAEGYAATDVSAVYHVFEITGAGIADLLCEAILIDPENGGPSAAVVFAGLQAILYWHGDKSTLRLHVERGHAAYVVDWLKARS
jgi:sarcosine oxidase gamma subunit